MKKGLKLTLAVLMVASVLMSLIVTASAVAVPESYLDASKYVITDGTVQNASQPIFKDGKVTFKINLSSGITVTGAMVTVKYDKKVLKLVDAGPAVTTDEDGNETEIVTGMHTHGASIYDDSSYTFAYISSTGYNTGSTGKEFAFITFEVIDKSCPKTTVEFVAGDYTSTSTIKKFAGQDGTGFATLDSGIIASFTAGKKAVTVKWNSVAGATEYLIYRKGGADKSFRAIATSKNISYTDTENIENNTTYTYAVRAKNASGYGWYEGKSFTYLDATNITVTNASSGVKIAWDKVEGATEYRVYKRQSGESKWTRIEVTDSQVLTVTDKTITSGIEYEYGVIAVKNSDLSALSNIEAIRYVGMVSKVTLANAPTGVKVTWASVDGAEKYRIYRKLKGENEWTVIKTVNADVLTLTDKAAVSGKTNYYAVKAYANGAWGTYKSEAINYIATPQVTKTTSTVGTGITLKWNAVAGAAQYRVYRHNGTKWALLGKVTGTSYTDKNVTLGKSYKYTLRAENSSNLSSYNSTGWTVKYTLTTPTVSKVTTSSTAIKLQWGAVKGASGYIVYRKAEGASSWTRLGTTTGTAYTDKNVKVGTVYYYTIKAYKGSSYSGYNKTGWVGVILTTPTVKISNASNGISVSWSKVKGAKGYNVYSSQYNQSTGKWSSWKKHGTVAATTFSWVDKSVSSGTTYRYTVKAVNGLCGGGYKASASLKYLAQPTVTLSNAANGITVKWTKATGATGYRIYRAQLDATSGKWSSWKTMGNVASSKSAWTDKSVTDGVTYKYTVRTVSGKVLSSYKASSALMFLEVPQLLSCSRDANGIVLEFKANENADSYRIYRKTLYTDWTLLETVAAIGEGTYIDENVIEGTEYIYTVKSVNGKSVSYFDKAGISSAE